MMYRLGLPLLFLAFCGLVGCSSAKPGSAGQPPAATSTAGKAEPTYRHVVAADHELASLAGLEMLRKGGNAVDAAVATSFALSVVRPYSCGIGGGGFMLVRLVHHPKLHDLPRTIAIDYREVAPGWARSDFFETDPVCSKDPDASTRGAHAVAIPGTVAGLLYALERYGTLPRSTVLEPAIRYAEQGFAVDADYASTAERAWKNTKDHPGYASRFAEFSRIYLKDGTIRRGDTLRLAGQAAALRLISRDGADAFYKGAIASDIFAALTAGGVKLPAADLGDYKPRELSPLECTFRGKRVLTFPPPSSGGIVLVQTLGMIDARRTEFDGFEYASSPALHFLAEALKQSFADRSHYLADPAFVDVPTLELTSGANVRELAARIDMSRSQPPDACGSHIAAPQNKGTIPPDAGTSHLCAVDSWGNAVACTETINLSFGSYVCVPNYGFLLNDQMDDFTTRPDKPNAFGLRQDVRNLPAPGKQPLSSMSPTIVLAADRKDSPVELVVGASGGPWIITGTLQVLLNSEVYGIPASQAVAQPRIHHQWMPDVLDIQTELADSPEPGSKRTVNEALRALGHKTKVGKSECVVQAIRRSPTKPDKFEAGSDPRKGGKPAGE